MKSQVLTCSLYPKVPETLNLTPISKHFMALNILDQKLHFLVTIYISNGSPKCDVVLPNPHSKPNEILDLPCTQLTQAHQLAAPSLGPQGQRICPNPSSTWPLGLD